MKVKIELYNDSIDLMIEMIENPKKILKRILTLDIILLESFSINN